MSYKIEDIVKNDLCVGCGICTSESGSSVMQWNEYGFLIPKLDGSFNENAIKVCPFNPKPDAEVQDEDALASLFFKDSKYNDNKIGRFENTYVGYANQHRETSSSGGIATYIFEQLLQQKIVDHLFIVKQINGTYQYQWFDDFKQIKAMSKTRYIPVTLENLFKEINSKEGKAAVSGVACFVKAIRLKQHYNPQYKTKIPFVVGIICGGLKSSFFTDYLAQKSGIQGRYSKQEYRIKDPNSVALDYSFGAYNQNEQFHQLKMNAVGDMWGSGMFKANACDFCDDVTTELADISLGDAWLAPYKQDGLGTSVIVTRSKLADQLVINGINKSDLSVKELSILALTQSQAGSFKHRQSGLKYRIKLKEQSGQLIPFKRKRILKNIPVEFQIVQKQRMKVRLQSLVLWRKYKNSQAFEKQMTPHQSKLEKQTTWYHRFQKIKKKLGLESI